MAYFNEHGLALTLLRKIRRTRRKWFNRMLSWKLEIPGGINVDPSAQILGLSHITIGRSFKAGSHLKLEALSRYESQTFTPKIVIKDNVVIHDFVHIGATNYIEIGNDVLMASHIYISDHNHGFYYGNDQSDPDQPPAQRPIDASRSVVIEDNVWLGEFVSVLPGVRIGKGSIIGANSVVARDIPPHCIAVGSPAKVIKRYDPERQIWVPVPSKDRVLN